MVEVQCGIHGVLLVCLKQTRLVHMVRIGSATAVVGELLHGLNLQVTTGKLPFKTNVWYDLIDGSKANN